MEEQFLVKNFNDDNFIEEKELLAISNDFIEENVLIKIINDCIDEDTDYLRVKNRELMWLVAKARFRAIKY